MNPADRLTSAARVTEGLYKAALDARTHIGHAHEHVECRDNCDLCQAYTKLNVSIRAMEAWYQAGKTGPRKLGDPMNGGAI